MLNARRARIIRSVNLISSVEAHSPAASYILEELANLIWGGLAFT